MAILNGIISKLNGSAGNLTFKHLNGQTVVSEKVTNTTDAKTDAQQRQRMKLANVIRMYQVLQPYMKLAFGGQSKSGSDYHKFVSSNVPGNKVSLTKQMVEAGACIVAPYEVTHGKLKSLKISGKGKSAVTNIAMGGLTINADTTVAAFSNAVVQNNVNISYGDQITYFLVMQDMNEVTNTPLADVYACCIVLDKTSDAKLLSLVDPRGFSVQNDFLAADASAEFGDHGMVWILSRKKDGKTILSTQYLICENTLLEQYQSEAAYDLAVASYGGAKEAYLTPSGQLQPEVNTPAAGNTQQPTTGGGSTVVTPPAGGSDNGLGE